MTKKGIILKKIISVFLILWGTTALIWSIFIFKEHSELYEKIYRKIEATPSVFSAIKIYHLTFIIPLFNVFSGIVLLQNKKIGWILAILSSVLNCINAIRAIIDSPSDFGANLKWGAITAIFLTISIMLVTKPILSIYKPTKTTWLTIIFIVLLFLSYSIMIENYSEHPKSVHFHVTSSSS